MGFCLDKALLGLGGAGLAIGIEKLAEMIKVAVNTARPPASNLAPLLTTIESDFRPGLSAIALTTNIVNRLGEAGIDTSTLKDGSEPQITKLIRIFSEEFIKEIQLNMKGVSEIRPGTLMGMAGQIPVVSTLPIQCSTISY